jgi:pyruvoyl-dependent arginine decarboxylase (PvlArgDC)
MKTHLILILASSLTLVSCTSSGGGMSRGLIGAGIGGLLGTILGDSLGNNNNNNAAAAAGGGAAAGGNNNNGGFLEDNQGLVTGAVAGYAAGAITDAMAKKEVRERYLDGYNKGRSDAIKDLYWVKRDAERPNSDTAVQRRYYEVPVPEHVTTDGVLVEPRKVVIEVVE